MRHPLERGARVVDAANVVGARPDGWWRDRAGAARRLCEALAASGGAGWDAVVVVLEGAARAGADAGETGDVTVVHAPGSGDDTLVDECVRLVDAGVAVTLASADRGLLARVGGRVTALGPRTLRDLIGL